MNDTTIMGEPKPDRQVPLARMMAEGFPTSVSKEAVEAELNNALGCFDAAALEGLYDRLAEVADDERGAGSLYDLITRRIMFAPVHIRAAQAAITALLATGEVVVKSEVDYMKMRLAQIASGDYKACGLSAEWCAADALIHGKLPAQKEGAKATERESINQDLLAALKLFVSCRNPDTGGWTISAGVAAPRAKQNLAYAEEIAKELLSQIEVDSPAQKEGV